jgi:uncharacterized protein YndB with AHSA1/START domain
MENQPIITERTFNVPIAKVWEALTDNKQMKKWYFDLPDFKPEVGFEFSFSAGEKNKQYLHLCKVKEVVPAKKIAYSWRYDGYPGNSLVSFELFEEDKKTKLRLVHEGLETFGTSNPDLAKENFSIGWNYILDKSLKDYLSSEQ